MKEAQLEAEVKLLRKENEALRRHIAVLQAEVYGARLAAKYLDKELAGRCVENGYHCTLVLLGDQVHSYRGGLLPLLVNNILIFI